MNALVAPLWTFMIERHRIYQKRAAGEPWPWTDDPILREYRFCNVFRNLDKETRLIHTNWLAPNGRSEDVWFACVVARLVNWWPTLEEVGYPVPWSPMKFSAALEGRKARGEKVFTGAYMVRADANDLGSKSVYLANRVINPIWENRDWVRPRKFDTLKDFHKRLMDHRDMGSFMAAQVVADAKYFDTNLLLAKDWSSWAAPGPGSLRGLNRVLGRDKDATWHSVEWEKQFRALHEFTAESGPEQFRLITGQDLQNCLCEFDKHERVRLGQGKPRSRYQPPKEQVPCTTSNAAT